TGASPPSMSTMPAMREATLTRGRLAEHPVWSRALGTTELAPRTILPVIVSSAVEDREKVDVAPWLERLSLTEVVREARAAAMARVRADAGAALLVPSGMLDGSVRALRAALGAAGRDDLPVAAVVKLESALYVTHRAAVQGIPIAERAVPLIGADDAAGAVARARGDMADDADAVVVKPGAPGLDIVARLATFASRPLASYFTPD